MLENLLVVAQPKRPQNQPQRQVLGQIPNMTQHLWRSFFHLHQQPEQDRQGANRRADGAYISNPGLIFELCLEDQYEIVGALLLRDYDLFRAPHDEVAALVVLALSHRSALVGSRLAEIAPFAAHHHWDVADADALLLALLQQHALALLADREAKVLEVALYVALVVQLP